MSQHSKPRTVSLTVEVALVSAVVTAVAAALLEPGYSGRQVELDDEPVPADPLDVAVDGEVPGVHGEDPHPEAGGASGDGAPDVAQAEHRGSVAEYGDEVAPAVAEALQQAKEEAEEPVAISAPKSERGADLDKPVAGPKQPDEAEAPNAVLDLAGPSVP